METLAEAKNKNKVTYIDENGNKVEYELKGEVKKFQNGKIPQIGWNKIETTDNNSFLTSDYFYFVNSYYVLAKDEKIPPLVASA